jgi:hypothetical protein
MLASNRVECCPERFQMQAATISLLRIWREIFRWTCSIFLKQRYEP